MDKMYFRNSILGGLGSSIWVTGYLLCWDPKHANLRSIGL